MFPLPGNVFFFGIPMEWDWKICISCMRKNLIKLTKGKIRTNKYKFQNMSSEISTCARWCALRSKFLELDANIFVSLVQSGKSYTTKTNDNFVTIISFLTAPRHTKSIDFLGKK